MQHANRPGMGHTVLVLVSPLARYSSAWADDVPAEATDRVASIFDFPESSEHLGLLGKHYAHFRYLHSPNKHPVLSRYDDSIQGMDALFNLHAKSLDLVPTIDVDLFFAYTHEGLDGTRAD